MGCDDYPTLGDGDIIGGRYQIIGAPVAVQWDAQMAQLFPNADHRGCRQRMRADPTDGSGHWAPCDPPQCLGYHCPRCGAATGSFGHRPCDKTRPA